jgi:enoyl-CoA hydratase/carnithine racemase
MAETTGVRLHAGDAQGIACVELSNPGKLNALSVSMWHQLARHFTQLAATPTRVIIVRGEGGQFAAGGDIEEFPDFRFDESALRDFHEGVVRPALMAMWNCDIPVLAQIDGACIGGGLEIAACCDIRIAGAGSRFGVPIAKLGFPMAPAELEIVSRVFGMTLLRELLLESRVIGAAEALQRGVVNRVVADPLVAAETRASAERIAALSPQALRLNKRALREFGPGTASTAEQRAPHYAYADSAEHREGLAAFNQRRPARF